MQAQENLNQLQVYNCTFEFNIIEATMVIKFPCSYYVQIKSLNNKITIASTKKKVTAVNSIASFNQLLRFQTELLYNNKRKQFLKKQILVILNLISTRRPDQQKLVGRVTVDLAEVINVPNSYQPQAHKLDYCSVSASVNFGSKFIGKKLSMISPQNFDKDSFSDFQSFIAGIHHTKENPAKHRSFEESDKTVEMQWKNKTNEVIDKNKVIEQSQYQETQSKIQTGRNSHKNIGNTQNVISKSSIQASSDPPFYIPKLPIGQQSSQSHSLKNQYISASSGSPIAHMRSSHDQNYLNQQQHGSRIRPSDLSQRSYSRKQVYINQGLPSQIYTQPINQYQDILRNSHAQEKRIWDQEKRLLNQQIIREKQENSKLKERNESLEKKLYQTQLKLCNIEGKIQNSKRQMVILQRQKDLQIKQLKARVERITKEKNQKSQHLQLKQIQFKQYKEKLRSQEQQKRRNMQQTQKQQSKLHQKLQSAQRKLSNTQQQLQKLQKQKRQKQNTINGLQSQCEALTKQNKRLKEKITRAANQQKQIERLKLENQRMQRQIQSKIAQYEQQINKISSENKGIIQQFEQKQLQIMQTHQQQLSTLQNQKQIQLQSLQQSFRSTQVHLQEQLQAQAGQISQLQSQIIELNQKLQKTNEELKDKDRVIEKIEIELKALNGVAEGAQGSKEYVGELEAQVLGFYEEQVKLQGENQSLLKKIEGLQETIKEMKNYQKGLQQQLINNTSQPSAQQLQTITQKHQKLTEQNQQVLQRHQELSQNYQSLTKQYQCLSQQQKVQKSQSDQTIKYLQTIIEQLNSLIQTKNRQINSLTTQRNQYNQYCLKLQEELTLEKTGKKDGQGGGQEKVRVLEERLRVLEQEMKVIREESRGKDSEIDKLRIMNIELKEYHFGIEQQLIQVTEQLQHTREQMQGQQLQPHLEEGKSSKPKDQDKQKDRQIQQLKQKISQLQTTIKQKNQYQKQLQKQILNDHDIIEAPANTDINSDRGKGAINEGTEGIMTEGIQREKGTGSEQLNYKVKELEVVVQGFKQYQESLEEKILADYYQLQNSKNQLQTIKNQLQAALFSHETQTHQLKTTISELQHKLQLVSKSKTTKQQATQKQAQNLANMQQIIQQKQKKITELQDSVRECKRQIQMLEEEITSYRYRSEYGSNAKNQGYGYDGRQQQDEPMGQDGQDQDQNEPMLIPFGAIIRVLEAHSASQQNQQQYQRQQRQDFVKQQKYQQQKQQQKSTQIVPVPTSTIQPREQNQPSQPVQNKKSLPIQPILNKKSTIQYQQQNQQQNYSQTNQNDIADFNSDQSPMKQMEMDIEMVIPNDNAHEEIEGSGDRQGREKEIDMLRDIIDELRAEVAAIHSSGGVGVLATKVKEIESQKEALIKLNRDAQVKIRYLQSKTKTLQQKLTQSPKTHHRHTEQPPHPQTYTQTLKTRLHQLQSINKQYQGKIKALRAKEERISEAMVVVERESEQIYLQMEEKEKELEALRGEVEGLRALVERGGIGNMKKQSNASDNIYIKQITSLNQIHQVSPINQYKQSQTQAQKYHNSLNSMQKVQQQEHQHQKQQQRQRQCKPMEIPSQSELTLTHNVKYEELLNQLNEMARQQEERERAGLEQLDKISRLEKQLKDTNDQLAVNKRLILRMKDSGMKSSGISTLDNNTIAQLTKKNSQLTQKNSQLSQKNSQLSQKNIQINQKSSEVTQKNNQLTKQNIQLSEKITMLTQQINTLTNESNTQRKRIIQLQQQLFCLQSNQNQKQIQNQYLKNQVSSLRLELERSLTQSHPNTNRESKEDKEAEILLEHHYTVEIEKLREYFEGLKTQLEAKVGGLQGELSGCKLELEASKKELQACKKEIEEKKSALRQNQNQLTKLQTLMKAQRLQYFTKRRQLLTQTDQQTKQLEQQSVQLLILQQKTKQQKQKIGKLEQELQQQKQSNLGLIKQIENYKLAVMEEKNKLEFFKRQKLAEDAERNKQDQYLLDLESKIVKQQGKIKEKEEQIQQLKSALTDRSGSHTPTHSRSGSLDKMMASKDVKAYNQQIGILQTRVQQLQLINKIQINKLQEAERMIDQLSYELQICQQQNQLNSQVQKKKKIQQSELNKKQKQQKQLKRIQQLQSQLQQSRRDLTSKNQKLSQQINTLKEQGNLNQKIYASKIKQYQQKIKKALADKQKAIQQLQQKQMMHMNTELDYQFKLRQKSQKSQILISSINENQSQLKRSFNASQQIGLNDLIPATKTLKQLVTSRSQKTLIEKQIQVMAGRINQLEEQIFGNTSNAKQKGLILQKTRLMSMQFSKLKVQVMKSKIISEQRMKLLSSFKPMQNSIKDILKFAEIFSENLLSMEITGQNSSRI